MKANTIHYTNSKGVQVSPMFSTFEKDILIPQGMKEHHTSLTMGYQSTKCHRAERYTGRFGTGWKVYHNNPNSTRYCLVTYYIKEENA